MRNLFPILLLLAAACTPSNEKEESLLIPSEIIIESSNADLPALYSDLSGNAYLTWVEKSTDSTELRYKRYIPGTGWTDDSRITAGKDWFVNWADYPALATAQGEVLYSHHLKKSSPDTYSYDILVSRSSDGGRTWEAPFMLNEDGTHTEHGFVSMIPSGNDMFMAWLDGRNTTSDKNGPMTLRAALFAPDGSRKGEWQLDDRTCDCCQTGAAMTENGPVVVYRDRSANEFRDIAIVRFENYKWTEPMLIHRDAWQISGCPVNGPRIDAKGNDVVISWFTAPQDKPQVNVVFSSDGGRSFSSPVRVSGEKPIGRTDVILLEPGLALVSWVEDDLFRAVQLNSDGEISNEWRIGHSGLSHMNGFPQLTRAGEGFLAVWKENESGDIRSAFLNRE